MIRTPTARHAWSKPIRCWRTMMTSFFIPAVSGMRRIFSGSFARDTSRSRKQNTACAARRNYRRGHTEQLRDPRPRRLLQIDQRHEILRRLAHRIARLRNQQRSRQRRVGSRCIDQRTNTELAIDLAMQRRKLRRISLSREKRRGKRTQQ